MHQELIETVKPRTQNNLSTPQLKPEQLLQSYTHLNVTSSSVSSSLLADSPADPPANP